MGQNNRSKYACLLTALLFAPTAGLCDKERRSDKIDPFMEALVGSYQTNSELQAAIKEKFAADEEIPKAFAGYKPTVEAKGSLGTNRTENQDVRAAAGVSDPNPPARRRQRTRTDPSSGAVTLKQNLFNGLGTMSQVEVAESFINSIGYKLKVAEQKALLDAVKSYTDVVFRRKAIGLNQENVKFLEKIARGVGIQAEVGEKTITDVNDAQSRLFDAEAKLTAAEGDYEKAASEYEKVVGKRPDLLVDPVIAKDLPESSSLLVEEAVKNDPRVLQAFYEERKARSDIDVKFAGFLPQLDAEGSVSRSLGSGTRSARTNQGEAKLVLTIPFDTNGSVSANTRQVTQSAAQKRYDLEQARKKARTDAVTAWSEYQTAKKQVVQYETNVKFAIKARDGATLEADLGEKSFVDLLDTQQKLYEAQINLQKAKKSVVDASYAIKASVAECTAAKLKLPVANYDIQGHYEDTKYKFFGTSVN